MIFETDIYPGLVTLVFGLVTLIFIASSLAVLGLRWWLRRRDPVLRGKVTFNGFTAGPLRTEAKLQWNEEKQEMDAALDAKGAVDFGKRTSSAPYLAITFRDPVHGRITMRIEDPSAARELLHDMANVGERWRIEFHREGRVPRLVGRHGMKETPFGNHPGGGV